MQQMMRIHYLLTGEKDTRVVACVDGKKMYYSEYLIG